MNSLLLKIASVAVVFDFIEAIPVPIRSFGERNVALLSVLSCIGIGAAIGMCVFCKKKKGQFKKFENDGNVDSKSTEYPILKSLNSLDTKKTGAIIPSSPTNLSTDNLLEQSVQYQNESYNDDFNSNVLLSSKESLSSASPIPARTSYSLEQETTSSKHSTDFGDEKPLIGESSVDAGIDAKKEGDSSQLDVAVQSLTHLEDVTISLSGRLTFPREETTTASAQEYGAPEDVTPMDSLEDNSSIHETNSIEEALRALDIAIDGEDESDDNSFDEPSFAGYSIDMDKRVSRDEPEDIDDDICNEKNSSSDSGMDEIEMSEKATTPDTILHELVRQEATKLVNEVLQVCQSRIEEILECDESEQTNQAVSVEEDFDDFNSGVVLECSTPFVAKRFDDILEHLPGVKNALFCDDKKDNNDTASENLAEALLDNSEDDDNCTQVETGLASKEPNVTYQTNINDEIDDLEQIYPANNNTVTLLPVNTTHTIGSDSFEKGQNVGHLPEITVEEATDDAMPDKLTATPMNTPIELGCPTTAEWDRWLSANATGGGEAPECTDGDCFNSQTFDEGWFLHAQPGCSKDNDCNETYDLLDQNDDLDSTYDLLRKHLAEMLPHAQGAKEAAGCLEDSGSPDHRGEKGLDEASNVPSTSAAKDNEMIINYKRTLSPIMEESEDESFYNKTSYYKEASNYVESTSTGCMESLTAMGVNKTLMASNDTLFNFEDVLDEILSPRIPSQSHTPTNRDRDITDQRLRSPRHVTLTESTSTNELLPQLARDSSLSSTGDTARIDFSQDSTFTLDEKTCISLSRPNEEDERISEISEPILVSSSSGLNKPDDANSLMDEEIASIEDDSFDRILEKEKPLENEQYNHFLDLRNTVEPMLELDPPEPDENFDPASMLNSAGQETVYLQNKINLESMYTNRNLDEQVVIESIDRFLLKSRNISLPDDKSTNGHLSSSKISSRSDGKNICIDYDNLD